MAQTTLKKENSGYNYKYTDLAQINAWCEANGIRYAQVIKIVDGQQFIETTYTKDGKDYGPFLGAQVIKAAPGGKVNEAQIYGSGLTYARRYSLLMCFGLATDDDDAECYTQQAPQPRQQTQPKPQPAQQKPSVSFKHELDAMKAENDKAYDAVREIIKNNGWKSCADIPESSYQVIRDTFNIAKMGGNNG